ncbi:MAG: 50S ribosomal protein L31 [Elusimicrobia bacterium]|nr:50S ribosomal protein L31 [Elusimicrobiota bacterium]
MKEGIHPKYVLSQVTCACGNSFATRSTQPVIKLEICSACHPFYTGKQKLIDTAGRVERFKKRFAKTEGQTMKRAAKKTTAKRVLPILGKGKLLTTAPRKAKSEKKS